MADCASKFNEYGRTTAEAAGLDPSEIPARPDCFEVVPRRRGLKTRGWKVRYKTILRDEQGAIIYRDGNIALSDWKTAPLPRWWEPSH